MSVEGVYKLSGRTVQFVDGAGNWLTLNLIESQITVAMDGQTLTEAMHRGRHLDAQAPVVHDVADGKITGQCSFKIESFPEGTAPSTDALRPFAWLMPDLAAAAGLISTLKGDAWGFEIRVVDEQPGSTQTRKFLYCAPEKPSESDGNGLLLISFTFTDYEKSPVVLPGSILES